MEVWQKNAEPRVMMKVLADQARDIEELSRPIRELNGVVGPPLKPVIAQAMFELGAAYKRMLELLSSVPFEVLGEER